MIRAAVLGSPISHSLSPALHKRAYEILNLPASYGAIELTPEHAFTFFSEALHEDWTGFSLTMPLKECIFEENLAGLFDIDPIALHMRSANTLVRSANRYMATSTDRTGFIRLFDKVKKEKVAIIGGGGTARAALSALDGVADQVDFLLRTPGRAEFLKKIATRTQVNFFEMSHSLRNYDLVIATVPSGVSDAIAKQLDFKIPVLCEVLYKPFPTELLAKAQAMGSQTFDGIDLLVEQAMDQVALFSGREYDYDHMRVALQAVGRSHLN